VSRRYRVEFKDAHGRVYDAVETSARNPREAFHRVARRGGKYANRIAQHFFAEVVSTS
jgi:hypothetical protein